LSSDALAQLTFVAFGLLVLDLLAAGCDCRRRLRFPGSEKRKCGRRSSFDHRQNSDQAANQ
jgi:hypothetical protein